MTKKAAAGVAGVRTFTCTRCGATKTEAIAALPGGVTGKSYKVAGSTYKVKVEKPKKEEPKKSNKGTTNPKNQSGKKKNAGKKRKK